MHLQVNNKEILKIALPIAFSLLIPQISFFANAAFLGQLGVDALLINGLAGIFYLLLTWISYGLANGVMVVLSRKIGANDMVACQANFQHGFVLSAISCILLLAATVVIAPIMYTYVLHDTTQQAAIQSFLFIRIAGLPFLMFYQMMNALFIALGRSRLLIWAAFLGNIVAVGGDYLLIFGYGSWPRLGVNGAAIASVAAEIVMAVTAFAVYKLRGVAQAFPLWKRLHLQQKVLKNILQISSPLILQYIFSIGGWQLFFIYVEHLGKEEVAISHILRSVLGIASVITWSMASTCNTVVSKLIGQGDVAEVPKAIRKIVVLSVALTSIFSVAIYAFPAAILQIYTQDVVLLQLGLGCLQLIGGAILVMAASTVLFNAVVGTGNTWVNLAIESSCVLIYCLYIYVIMDQLKWPLQLAWTSEFVYWGSLLIMSFLYLKTGKWKGKLI